MSTSDSVVEGCKVYFNYDGGAGLCLSRKHILVANARPNIKRTKSVFGGDGHCWLFIQRSAYTCTGLAIVMIPVRFSLLRCGGSERAGLR